MMSPSRPVQPSHSFGDDSSTADFASSQTFAAADTVTTDSGSTAPAPALPPLTRTTTVLPRIETDGSEVRVVSSDELRYEPIKLLGTGGMGEVVLVRDRDIARPVAIKRLLPRNTGPSVLARFVDEIRTVGRLEHPNIVPIHDVGIDDLGRYYFVMKYIEGETLESIIAKLAAGDPEYHRLYPLGRRMEIFLGLLYALDYTHSNEVVHRDIKPANIMVGRYGEVVLMDWGIAKPLDARRDPAGGAHAEIGTSSASDESQRMYATQIGALIGTPAYMSPEQARGENDRIDTRSDLYSATVVFYELMSLRHYLSDQPSVLSMLAAVATDEITISQVMSLDHPHQHTPPIEMLYFTVQGLAKDPDKRFQSAGEMLAELQRNFEGKLKVRCPITFTKRTFREMGMLVDRRPWLSLAALLLLLSALLFTVAHLTWLALA